MMWTSVQFDGESRDVCYIIIFLLYTELGSQDCTLMKRKMFFKLGKVLIRHEWVESVFWWLTLPQRLLQCWDCIWLAEPHVWAPWNLAHRWQSPFIIPGPQDSLPYPFSLLFPLGSLISHVPSIQLPRAPHRGHRDWLTGRSSGQKLHLESRSEDPGGAHSGLCK